MNMSIKPEILDTLKERVDYGDVFRKRECTGSIGD
jgi:hypothetical protein